MNGWMGCLLGIVIGAGGCLVWQRYKGPDPELVTARQQIVELTRERADTVGECAKTREHAVALGIVNQDLNRRLQELPPPSVPPASTGSTDPPEFLPPPPPMDRKTMRAFQERRLKDEAERLKRRLLLTPAQCEKLDRVLAEGLKATGDNPFFNLASAPWFKDELDRLLTPEQKTNYETLQEKDKVAQTEMSARFELNQLEHAVDITDAQRQALLPKLAERARAMIDSGPPPAPPEDGVAPDPLAHMQLQVERRLEAVSAILTAPQLEEYRKHLTTQMEGVASMMKAQEPKAVPPSVPPSP